MYAGSSALAPSPSVVALNPPINMIAAVGTVHAGSERAAAAPVRHDPHDLPPQPTPLLDRDAERAAVSGLLGRDDVHLVTLTGPGGVGKTRLALAVAEAAADRFPGSIRFVDLTPYEDHSAAGAAITAALSTVQLDIAWPGDDQGDAGCVPSDRRALLVLDNCEHLLPGLSRDIADLLSADSHVVILATSREPLRLRWERRLPVRPLGLPALGDEHTPEALLAAPAVALFVARARAVRPDFVLTPENGAAVAELCRRLDGLPLAIELAAAWADLLSPAGLLERLDRHLSLPSRAAEDLPARHRTLDAAIGWSYERLGSAERWLLHRLAPLPTEWTLGQVEEVADRAPGFDVLAALLALVDKGLVACIPQDEPLFGMLQTVRAYAADLQMPDWDGSDSSPGTMPAALVDNPLSTRERAVLRLVADGLPSKLIGRELGLAERTVKSHLSGAMNKLGAFTRAQALAIALQHDYV
jgi:predicted ATPase/DNA-binding CsgD family transcriptional regulator